jgi:hypothetical protein
MPETVRVRCAVAVDIDGGLTIVGATWAIDGGEVLEMVDLLTDIDNHRWVTVEIPLPVEPVVVAEVEDVSSPIGDVLEQEDGDE